MLRSLLPESYAERDALHRVGRAPKASLHGTLRVLVWNILKAKRREFASDFARLCADRDLVLLQEAVLNAPSDAWFAALRFEWMTARSFRDPQSGVQHGVRTGCVARAVAAQVRRSPHVEPIVQTRKLLLVTRYRLQTGAAVTEPGRYLLVLNLHAINFVRLAQYRDQLTQVEEVLQAHDGPLILAGDFNTWSLRRRQSFFDLAGNAALSEVPLQRRSRVSHMSMHLDHVLYRGLQLHEAASLGHITSSDHAPITVTFGLD